MLMIMMTSYTLMQLTSLDFSVGIFSVQALFATIFCFVALVFLVLSHSMNDEPSNRFRLGLIFYQAFREFDVSSRPEVNLNAPAIEVFMHETNSRGVRTYTRSGFVRDLNDRTGTAFAWLINNPAMTVDPLCHTIAEGYIGFRVTVTEPYIGRPRAHVEFNTRLLVMYGITRVKVDGRAPIWNHQGGISSTIVHIDVGY